MDATGTKKSITIRNAINGTLELSYDPANDQLGEGGFGTVYRATDPYGKEYALKRVELKKSEDPEEEKEERRSKIERITGLYTHMHHNNVESEHLVQLLGYQEENEAVSADKPEDVRDVLYIVQNLVPGKNLGSLMETINPFPPKEVLNIAKDMAEALKTLHYGGIFHRDIKPGNIIQTTVDGKNRYVLCDYGVSFINEGANFDRENVIMGTLHYLPPEQASRGFGNTETKIDTKIDNRADLYSLGATLFYLLTGQHPIIEESVVIQDALEDIASGKIQMDILESNTDIPDEIKDIVKTLLETNPEDRYLCASTLLKKINEVEAELYPAKEAENATPAERKTITFEDQTLTLLEKIGTGGLGTVWHAINKEGHSFAVKMITLPSDPDAAKEKVADIKDIHEKILRIADNDGLVRSYGLTVQEEEDSPSEITLFGGETPEKQVVYEVQEFVVGEDLGKITERQTDNKLTPGQALTVIEQMTAVLEEIGGMGLVHRDIKPDNIILTPEGVLKLCDFGLLANVNEEGKDISGTARYMSPEQGDGGVELTPKSDVYSLGITLYHLLAGEPIVNGKNASACLLQHNNEKRKKGMIAEEIPTDYQSLLTAMLKNDPEKRPDVEEIRTYLEEIKNTVTQEPLNGLAKPNEPLSYKAPPTMETSELSAISKDDVDNAFSGFGGGASENKNTSDPAILEGSNFLVKDDNVIEITMPKGKDNGDIQVILAVKAVLSKHSAYELKVERAGENQLRISSGTKKPLANEQKDAILEKLRNKFGIEEMISEEQKEESFLGSGIDPNEISQVSLYGDDGAEPDPDFDASFMDQDDGEFVFEKAPDIEASPEETQDIDAFFLNKGGETAVDMRESILEDVIFDDVPDPAAKRIPAEPDKKSVEALLKDTSYNATQTEDRAAVAVISPGNDWKFNEAQANYIQAYLKGEYWTSADDIAVTARGDNLMVSITNDSKALETLQNMLNRLNSKETKLEAKKSEVVAHGSAMMNPWNAIKHKFGDAAIGTAGAGGILGAAAFTTLLAGPLFGLVGGTIAGISAIAAATGATGYALAEHNRHLTDVNTGKELGLAGGLLKSAKNMKEFSDTGMSTLVSGLKVSGSLAAMVAAVAVGVSTGPIGLIGMGIIAGLVIEELQPVKSAQEAGKSWAELTKLEAKAPETTSYTKKVEAEKAKAEETKEAKGTAPSIGGFSPA